MTGQLAVSGIFPEAIGRELRVADHIVSIQGMPVRGSQDVVAPFHDRKPNDAIAVVVERAGKAVSLSLPPHVVAFGSGVLAWLFGGIAWLLMPWVSFLLGFWVAATRPRDPCAWMVLGILLGLAEFTNAAVLTPTAWRGIGGVLMGYHDLAFEIWPIAMLLFGLYFPQRWQADRKAPWAKWLLIVPLAFIGIWDSAHDLASAYDISFAQHWIPSAAPAGDVYQILALIAPCFFFIALSAKYRDPALHSDDRRRLKLLYWGVSAGLAPMFLLILFTLTTHHRMPGDQDDVFLAFALTSYLLVPLTMAYVLVIKRAMDVRMVVRQGVQYALAQRGLRLFQILISIAVIFFAVNLGGSKLSTPQRFTLIALGIVVVVRIGNSGQKLRGWLDRRFFREAYNSEQILGDLSEQVRSILDTGALLDTVTRKISESLHVDRIAVLLQQGSFYRPALATGYPGPVNVSIAADTPVMAQLRGSPAAIVVDEDSKEFGELDAQLLLPLRSKRDLLGFISLGPKKSEEPYSPSDTSLLQTVATQTGMALENSRLTETIASEIAQREMLNREIEIAREVQQRLFPQTSPECLTLDYAGHCRPARGVGGDYYDFLALPDGRLGIAIADISGKGIPAALLMASLQASVRGQSLGADPSVAALMANVNKLVYDASPSNRYATFFYAQYDSATRKLTYANGGHNPPMVLRGADVILLQKGGPPVGLFRPAPYEQDEIQLESGDLLVLFTDGISEAENSAQEEWGEPALEKTARACDGKPPADVITAIMTAADAFAAGAPQHDDMTVVIARVL